jgi:hypothetical protein
MDCRSVAFSAIILGAVGLIIPVAYAQQRSVTAKPDTASMPTPKMADGHPDLSGIWFHRIAGPPIQVRPDGSIVYIFPTRDGLPPVNVQKDPNAKIVPQKGVYRGHAFDASGKPIAPKRASAPTSMPDYKPQYKPEIAKLRVNMAQTDPVFSCMPPGLPRVGEPSQIVQGTHELAILYSDPWGNFFRTVAIDGRGKAAVHRIDRSYFGDSYGHWEGDTLVVDTDNFNDDTWLGNGALIHSKELHVTERFTRKGNTLLYQVTVTDPIMFTKPWVMPAKRLELSHELVPEEAPCVEMDTAHLVGNEGADESHFPPAK